MSDNIATAFAEILGDGGCVIGIDGETITMAWLGSASVTSGDAFKGYRVEGSKRSAAGYVLYYNDNSTIKN